MFDKCSHLCSRLHIEFYQCSKTREKVNIYILLTHVRTSAAVCKLMFFQCSNTHEKVNICLSYYLTNVRTSATVCKLIFANVHKLVRKFTSFLMNVRTSAAVCKLNFACSCPAALPCLALPCSPALLPCSVALPWTLPLSCPALLPCAAACCCPLLPCAAALHARLSHCMSLGTRDTCSQIHFVGREPFSLMALLERI